MFSTYSSADPVAAAGGSNIIHDAERKVERRAHSLDGLRGLAALSVVFLHLISIFLQTSFTQYRWVDRTFHILSYTPLAAIWDGGAAVLIFFVLSGFALHRMLGASRMTYGSFVTRRVLRLWLPYAAAILLAIASVSYFGSHNIVGQSAWLNAKLGTTLTTGLIIQHATMIGVFDFNRLDFVIWSLVQEMRLSLLFPLIYFALARYKYYYVLIGSLLIQIFALALISRGKYTDVSLIVTLKYQLYFVIGAIIAKQEKQIRKFVENLKPAVSSFLLLGLLVLYCNCLKLPTLFPTLVGAAGLVAFSLSNASVKKVLEWSFVQWLGKISYSLYLMHAVVLLGLVNLLYPKFSFFQIVLLSLPIIFAVSYGLNRLVELPSIKLSRLAGRVL